MGAQQELRNFTEFWPYYVGEHRKRGCRALHYLGTTGALSVLVASVAVGRPWFALAALLFGYGPAWIAHFFVEKNRPATFKYPFWSLFGDFKMFALALVGRMHHEVARLEAQGFRYVPQPGSEAAVQGKQG